MYTLFGSMPTQFSFDYAACSSNESPIDVTYNTVQSGLYYVLVVAGESTTVTVTLVGQH